MKYAVKSLRFAVLSLCVLLSCKKSGTQPVDNFPGYAGTPENIMVKNGSVPEASGIADSKNIPGHLWCQQDGGNAPLLYLLAHDGTLHDSLLVENATNRDWEDMVLAAGNIYIGDFGDNNLQYPDYNIYRFPEPLEGDTRVAEPDKINFKYPDGSHDAEAMLVDPDTKDIYIITKRDVKSRVYRLKFPQNTNGLVEAEFLMELGFTSVVSAALSADKREVIIKTYSKLYHYRREANEMFEKFFSMSPSTLGYQVEAQGEAVSFGIDNKGFFTLSEKALGIVPTLNYYKKNN